MMHPLEAFRAFGWRRSKLDGLTHGECWDLIGNSMALPTLAVVVVAAFHAVDIGVWEADRPSGPAAKLSARIAGAASPS